MDTIRLQVRDLAIKRVTPTSAHDQEFLPLIPAIDRFLKVWAETIPPQMLSLIGPRLQKIKDIILHTPFEIQYIWNSPPVEPELCIQYMDYKTNTSLLNASLTPKLILFKDLQTPYKEIAFPSTWILQEVPRVRSSYV